MALVQSTQANAQSSRRLNKQHRSSSATSFAQRCSNLALGRTSSSQVPNKPPQAIRYVQHLPSHPTEYKDCLESILEEAVGTFVHGRNIVAEELELVYNYDTLEAASPNSEVAVWAREIQTKKEVWVQAVVSEQAVQNGSAKPFAHGTWRLVRSKRTS